MGRGMDRVGADRGWSVPVRSGAALALALAIGWFGCTPPIDPELEVSAERPVRVRAAVEPATATIGDPLTYTLEVAHREGLAVEVPELPEALDGLRVAPGEASTESSRRRGQVIERRSYRLIADRVGTHVIPPLAVAWGDQGDPGERVATPELTIEVASVLAAGEGEPTDIRDVKPLRKPPSRWPAVAALIAAVLGGVALLAAWWWRRRRRAQATEPPLPPYEAALQALARLRHTDFGDPESVRAYYFALSEVVRVYVEGRFGLNATDLTTEEIVTRVGDVEGLSGDDSARLCGLLTAADRVKFARVFPSSREIEATFDQALAFVESTRPADSGERAEGGGGPPSAEDRPPTLRVAEGRG